MPNFPRELPTIKFGEDVFYVDTRLHEFRQKDVPHNIISFYDAALILDESILLCYDTKAKNIYRVHGDKI